MQSTQTSGVSQAEAASDFPRSLPTQHHSSGARGFQGSESQSVACKLEPRNRSSLSDSSCPFLKNVFMCQELCLFWACSRGQSQTWSLGHGV